MSESFILNTIYATYYELHIRVQEDYYLSALTIAASSAPIVAALASIESLNEAGVRILFHEELLETGLEVVGGEAVGSAKRVNFGLAV